MDNNAEGFDSINEDNLETIDSLNDEQVIETNVTETDRYTEREKQYYARIKKLEEELKDKETVNNSSYSEDLYPNFAELDEEAQNNLLVYTKNIERNVRNEINKDPALAFARGIYNEKQWDDAFFQVSEQYPELQTSRDDFKGKYFNPNNVPDNIGDILNDVAKIYLFDKVKEIGAQEERKKSNRIELETTTGGERLPVVSRSIEDWHELARTNPAKFAKLSTEYEEDSKKF